MKDVKRRREFTCNRKVAVDQQKRWQLAWQNACWWTEVSDHTDSLVGLVRGGNWGKLSKFAHVLHAPFKGKSFCTHLDQWGLCEYVIVHTILGGSPVIRWISLGGKPKWLPLKFGYHDVMRTRPTGHEIFMGGRYPLPSVQGRTKQAKLFEFFVALQKLHLECVQCHDNYTVRRNENSCQKPTE